MAKDVKKLQELWLGFNWKLNPESLAKALELTDLYNQYFGGGSQEVCLFPPAIYLLDIQKRLNTRLSLGSQEISSQISGAYTGQLSCKQVASARCNYSLIGHSEVRQSRNLNNQDCNQQLLAALANNLIPVLCIGYNNQAITKSESLPSDLINYSELLEQLKIGLQNIDPKSLRDKQIIIAYEPIWAIGTGKVATAEIIEEVIQRLKEEAESLNLLKYLKFVYGGSVKASNIQELTQVKGLQGFLIGGASLKKDQLEGIASLTN